MKKGKFGLVLLFYPVAAFICVILRAPLLCVAFLALAIFLEHDERTGRQCLEAVLLSVTVYVFQELLPRLISIATTPINLILSWLVDIIRGASSVIGTVVYLAAIVLSVLAILRLLKDMDPNIPLLSDIAYRLYGLQKPKAAAPAPGQYPPYTSEWVKPVQAQLPKDGKPAAQPEAENKTEENK